VSNLEGVSLIFFKENYQERTGTLASRPILRNYDLYRDGTCHPVVGGAVLVPLLASFAVFGY
jgi:hypothetical protein